MVNSRIEQPGGSPNGTDRVERVADLARRWQDAPLGDPEGLGGQLLDLTIEVRKAASEIEPSTEPSPQSVELAETASLARRWQDAPLGDPEGLGAKLLDRILRVFKRTE